MKAGIYLIGDTIYKTNNLHKKLKKETREVTILEEWELGKDQSIIDEKYNYWNRLLHPEENNKEEERELFFFKNPKTGYTVTSIYSSLEDCKHYIKDWEDYERVN